MKFTNKLLGLLLFVGTIFAAIYTPINTPNSIPSTTTIVNEWVEPLNDLVCVANSLYNAARMESRFGLNQPYANQKEFRNKIQAIFKENSYNNLDAIATNNIEHFSRQLNLQKCKSLEMLPGMQVSKSPDVHLTSGEMDDLMAKWSNTKQHSSNQSLLYNGRKKTNMLSDTNNMISELKSYIDINKNKTCLINFPCAVTHPEGPHEILISLAKSADGKRTIYINDNCNKAQTYPETEVYVNWIEQNII